MKLRNIFRPKDPPIQQNSRQTLIHEEMMFLLERNQKRFRKLLQAHLLDEGCNFPLHLALPRFYELMLTGLVARADQATQKKFAQAVPALQPITSQTLSTASLQEALQTHDEFYRAMRFFASNLNNAGQRMAWEVVQSIDQITQEWLLDPALFQAKRDAFDHHLHTFVTQLWHASHLSPSAHPPLDLIRRRLYIAWTNSLLRKMNVRHAFEAEFGSIPDVLNAMQADHAVFCRFMAFCQAQTPYFTYIASRTFWRTLETLLTQRDTRRTSP